MLSTIYLTNGARITIHVPWTQIVDERGHINYYSHPERDYFATITVSGVVHISNEKKYATYYQPGEQIIEDPLIADRVAYSQTCVANQTTNSVKRKKRRPVAAL